MLLKYGSPSSINIGSFTTGTQVQGSTRRQLLTFGKLIPVKKMVHPSMLSVPCLMHVARSYALGLLNSNRCEKRRLHTRIFELRRQIVHPKYTVQALASPFSSSHAGVVVLSAARVDTDIGQAPLLPISGFSSRFRRQCPKLCLPSVMVNHVISYHFVTFSGHAQGLIWKVKDCQDVAL